jgi:phosphate transport system permease protein
MPNNTLSKVFGWKRAVVDRLATAGAVFAAVLVIVPLLAIFVYLVARGAGALSWSFLTNAPKPVGETGGGIGNAMAGSALILGISCVIGVPLGIGAGIYLAEYGRGKTALLVRFIADVLNGVPSIVMGMAVYALVVLQQKHFSALAGGLALGVMMIPTVTRATEEMLLMVPRSIREAALGLGVAEWRTVLSVSLRTALPGVITGIMLAFARVAGETAPLLFTAFGNQFWNWNLNQPTAALPLQIYTYAISPYDEWHQQAWAGALVLIVTIVGTVAIVRLVANRGVMKGTS